MREYATRQLSPTFVALWAPALPIICAIGIATHPRCPLPSSTAHTVTAAGLSQSANSTYQSFRREVPSLGVCLAGRLPFLRYAPQ